MSTRPSIATYIRDGILFFIGVGLTIGQTGFPLLVETPPGGPSIPALVTGALFCNGPVVLQALALRFGGGTPSSAQEREPSEPEQPSAQSSVPSSGAE